MAIKPDPLIDYDIQLKNTWLDVNSRFTQTQRPLLEPGSQAIRNSLYNLFSCPIGARGPIFQPEYGTILFSQLQEPQDEQTAVAIRAGLIQSIERWEPRIRIIQSMTYVFPNPTSFGYEARVAWVEVLTNAQDATTFQLR